MCPLEHRTMLGAERAPNPGGAKKETWEKTTDSAQTIQPPRMRPRREEIAVRPPGRDEGQGRARPYAAAPHRKESGRPRSPARASAPAHPSWRARVGLDRLRM